MDEATTVSSLDGKHIQVQSLDDMKGCLSCSQIIFLPFYCFFHQLSMQNALLSFVLVLYEIRGLSIHWSSLLVTQQFFLR
jgi:hypothetical protein